MDYKEKYEAALDWMREVYPTLLGTDKEDVEHYFPELRESDDEKIRKALLRCCDDWEKGQFGCMAKEDVPAIRAYLEKQKEDKDELVYRLNGLMQEYIKEGEDEDEKEHRLKCYKLFWDALEDTSYFEQKEQKPTENGTRTKIISRATSEKQVVLLSESDGNAEIGWDTRSLEDTKKLLEYGIAFINKQLGTKSAEWSEEDEDGFNKLANCLSAFYNLTDDIVEKDKIDSAEIWLDQRMHKLRPNHWKPSEDQMKALRNSAYGTYQNGDGPGLRELYEQLKKLM